MIRFSLACILTAFLVSACGTQSSVPMVAIPTQTESTTATSQPIAKPTETATPEPVATATATEAPAPEFNDVGLDWENHSVSPDDVLKTGKYFAHLQNVAPTFDNPANLVKPECVGGDLDIFYRGVNKAKLNKPGTSPVILGTLSASITLSNVVLDSSNPQSVSDNTIDVLLPAFFYTPNGVVPVMFDINWNSLHNPNISPAQFQIEVNKMIHDVMSSSMVTVVGLNLDDTYYMSPLERQSLALNPDLKDRLKKFLDTCDPTYLSEPNLIIPLVDAK
jgi:hypothetical protein